MDTISLAVLDDHQVVITGLKNMLSGVPEITVAFADTNSKALIEFLEVIQTDVLLLDIQMPETSGIDLCKQIRKTHRKIKIIAFSSFGEPHYVKQMMRAGASGYLLKNADQETLVKAIRTVAADGEFIDETVKKLLLQESLSGSKRSVYEIPLTKREKEILKLIAEENTNQEIADKLFLSLRTVETHRFNLTQKLEAKNTASLVKEAIKRGIID
ncbi:response regulator [Adhaeribacter soli]|uniref:Response regulator transcription factor n=1 Tax=Adhaeribacter soli TaxID=2607655 RepID=A0A5N1IIN2_9BACT|nr:response regulator transcription factor [Adhaeribacter soli]KAA9325149.1 response regulator transcription factor [Adhaeribacter soli]